MTATKWGLSWPSHTPLAVGLLCIVAGVSLEPVCDADGTTCHLPGSSAAADRQALHEFFGEPVKRDDDWLRHASKFLKSKAMPPAIAEPVQQAVEAMSSVLQPDRLQQAWRALSAARTAAKDTEHAGGAVELAGRFLWRYNSPVSHALGEDAVSVAAELEAAVAEVPGAGEVQGGLLLARDGRKIVEMIALLKAATEARPHDERIALRYGVALHGKDPHSSAPVDAMMPHVQRATKWMGAEIVDARLLAAFAFLAASRGDSAPGLTDLVFKALSLGMEQTGTRGGAVAAVYKASLSGEVPFDLCQRIYNLERDLLFMPSHCHRRLELGTILRRLTQLPQAVSAGQHMLLLLSFDCPHLAETLSGMGMHWLEETDMKRKTVGLGGDLHSRADIRQSIRDASYAILDGKLARGESAEGTFYHHQAMVASRAVQKRAQGQPRQCQRPDGPAGLAPPKMKLKCRDVAPKDFAKRCLKQSLPCVIRGVGGSFLKEWEGAAQLLKRWVGFAGNTSIRVSFPFDAKQPEGLKSLNAIEHTSDFFAREDVLKSLEKWGLGPEDETVHPWTLVRPPNWNMRFEDLVTWTRHHSQEVYMNQLMVVDLGSQVINDLQTPDWVKNSSLKILSPSLWVASGSVATGYHTDSPANLLTQLGGGKEVFLLPPHEQKNLYYDEAADVEAKMHLGEDGVPEVSGLSAANRSSAGHSVIDISDSVQSAKFPRYKDAHGMKCDIDDGDVLFIPAFWHHAVATSPNEDCLGFSLNLWYIHEGKPSNMQDAIEQSQRQFDRRNKAKEKKGS